MFKNKPPLWWNFKKLFDSPAYFRQNEQRMRIRKFQQTSYNLFIYGYLFVGVCYKFLLGIGLTMVLRCRACFDSTNPHSSRTLGEIDPAYPMLTVGDKLKACVNTIVSRQTLPPNPLFHRLIPEAEHPDQQRCNLLEMRLFTGPVLRISTAMHRNKQTLRSNHRIAHFDRERRRAAR